MDQLCRGKSRASHSRKEAAREFSAFFWRTVVSCERSLLELGAATVGINDNDAMRDLLGWNRQLVHGDRENKGHVTDIITGKKEEFCVFQPFGIDFSPLGAGFQILDDIELAIGGEQKHVRPARTRHTPAVREAVFVALD